MTGAVRAKSANHDRIRAFRWFYGVGVLELLLYFLVPAIQFPSSVVLHVEVISALTLGNVVVVFVLLASVAGVVVDRRWRPLYLTVASYLVLWLAMVAVTWSRLERWDFLLR